MLGYIAYRRGNMDEAHQYLEKALTNGAKQGYFYVLDLSLAVLALIVAEAGDLEQAIELYAVATEHPFAGNSRWFEDMFGKRLTVFI